MWGLKNVHLWENIISLWTNFFLVKFAKFVLSLYMLHHILGVGLPSVMHMI